MLVFNSNANSSPAQAQHLVFELESERNALWHLYSELAFCKTRFDTTEIKPLLARFSQLLMDYVCLGHFGIYEYLSAHSNELEDVADFANRIYPVFSNTTKTAVSFNDQYDIGKRKFTTDNLALDLSLLGEDLAKRMEIEDQMCAMLLG